MQDDRNPWARLRQRVGHVVLFVALAIVPVLALNSLATADTGADPTGAGATASRPALSDTQRQCLSEQGVTLPIGGADGAKSQLTREQRRQIRQAGAACDFRAMHAVKVRPGARGGTGLTDAQLQCLADHGVSLPVRPADHPHTSVSVEQRDALRQAATTCGLPERGHHVGDDAKI